MNIGGHRDMARLPLNCEVCRPLGCYRWAGCRLGVALMAPWVAEKELSEGSLIMRPTPRSKIVRQWAVIHQGNRELRKPEQTFIGLCRMAVANLGRRSGDEPTIRAAFTRHSPAPGAVN